MEGSGEDGREKDGGSEEGKREMVRHDSSDGTENTKTESPLREHH